MIEVSKVDPRLSRMLRVRRAELQIDQDEAARRIGVSVRGYQEWEEGRAMPRQQNFAKIAQGLEMSLAELLVGEAVDEVRDKLSDQITALTEAVQRLERELHVDSGDSEDDDGRD